MAHNVIN